MSFWTDALRARRWLLAAVVALALLVGAVVLLLRTPSLVGRGRFPGADPPARAPDADADADATPDPVRAAG